MIYDMVQKKAVDGYNSSMLIYYLFWALFIFNIGVFRRYMVQGSWIQTLERLFMCCKPGKMLQFAHVSGEVTDVILDEDFLKTRRGKKSVRVTGAFHIRRSIDMTMTKVLESPAFSHIQGDDMQSPKYFLTGQGGASIDGVDELWTTHASVTSWAAWYGWCESIKIGSISIPLQDGENVLGHILLLETSEALGPSRLSTVCCLPLLPSCCGRNRVIQRRGYPCKNCFGNFKHGEPDAFIFKKKMMEETGLKIIHTFRIRACTDGVDLEASAAA